MQNRLQAMGPLGPVLRIMSPTVGPVTRSQFRQANQVDNNSDPGPTANPVTILQRGAMRPNIEVVYDVALLSNPNEPKTIQEALSDLKQNNGEPPQKKNVRVS